MVLSSNPTYLIFFSLCPFVGNLSSLHGMPLTKLNLYYCKLIVGKVHVCIYGGSDQYGVLPQLLKSVFSPPPTDQHFLINTYLGNIKDLPKSITGLNLAKCVEVEGRWEVGAWVMGRTSRVMPQSLNFELSKKVPYQ